MGGSRRGCSATGSGLLRACENALHGRRLGRDCVYDKRRFRREISGRVGPVGLGEIQCVAKGLQIEIQGYGFEKNPVLCAKYFQIQQIETIDAQKYGRSSPQTSGEGKGSQESGEGKRSQGKKGRRGKISRRE